MSTHCRLIPSLSTSLYCNFSSSVISCFLIVSLFFLECHIKATQYIALPLIEAFHDSLISLLEVPSTQILNSLLCKFFIFLTKDSMAFISCYWLCEAADVQKCIERRGFNGILNECK